MTRPVCEARTAAWGRMTQAQVDALDVTPDDMVRPLACLLSCPRPDGCGAAAGEECREPDPCPHCGGADGMHDMTCRKLDVMFGGPMPDADRIATPGPRDATPAIDPQPQQTPNGMWVWPTLADYRVAWRGDFCESMASRGPVGCTGARLVDGVWRWALAPVDATPAIDVSAMLATFKTLGILLRVTEGESIEDAARRVSRRADEQGLALTRLRRALGARDGESVEDAARRASDDARALVPACKACGVQVEVCPCGGDVEMVGGGR